MIELKGKYNNCKIFTDNVDDVTINQLNELLDQEFTFNSQIRIMPDTHAGKGCVIGTTMTIKDKVVPNLVGVDVGCGCLATKLEESDIDLQVLDDIIHEYIPSGMNVHKIAVTKDSYIDEIIAPIKLEYAYKSLGTLGGGNHFIEVDRDSNGNLWLLIHTGSRHLGIEVCDYYQDLAYKRTKKDIKEIIKELKNLGREKEIENTIKSISVHNKSINKDLCYVENEDFDNYIHDMKLAQQYASDNRHLITQRILDYANLNAVEQFDTIHNYIDTDDMILRKGSISAQLNKKSFIPMNMHDGSLICIGKGNPDWNYSAPHGAGRILSRSQARKTLSIDEYQESMYGIYTTCVNESTIDESPMVYKPMQEIIENIKDTVDVIEVIKPIYNFKAN